MVERYVGDDALMRFSVTIKAVDDSTCKIDICYDNQVRVCLREGKVCKSILLRFK